jgi:serine/threonine-protein kinase
LDLPEVLRIAGQVLRGLARAHDAQIVHRDLKPDNIFLCHRDDDPMFVKLVDFGISKVARSATVDTLTRRGTVLGTAFYMSPEQAQAFRDVDGRADLYSLGAILYEALSGRPPHVGTAYEAVLISICTTDAQDVRVHAPNVPEAVAQVIRKALMRDRDARYRTALEFYDGLAAAAPGLLSNNRPAGQSDGSRQAPALATSSESPIATGSGTAVHPTAVDAGAHRHSSSRQRRGLLLALVAGACVAAVAGLLLARSRAQQPTPQDSMRAERLAVPILAAGGVDQAAAGSRTSLAAPSAPAQGAPQVVRPADDPTPLEAAADAGLSPKSPPRAAGPARTARARPKPAARTSAAQKSGASAQPQSSSASGIAGGLELNTRGP